MKNLWKYSGYLLIGTGVIHNFVGLLMGWSTLQGMHQAGWWNTLESAEGINFERSAIVWFLLVGVFWLAMGHLMQCWLKQIQKPLPIVLGYSFIAVGIAVAIVCPVSGAWLFIPQGLIIILSPKTVIE